jgi:hypothetical protein
VLTLASLLLLLAAADTPPAAPRPSPAPAPFPEDYLMLLDAARGAPPAPELAREALAAWAGDRFAQALAGIGYDRTRAAAEPGAVARADDRTLAFAAMLHADLAFARMDALDDSSARAQLEMARGLLALLPDATVPARLKPRWFLGVGCRYRRDFELEKARAWLRAGLDGAPDDPGLLLALGSADELMATFRNPVCGTAAECPGRVARESYLAVEWDRQRLVTSAETLYRKALAADPGLAETRLRLGRLLALHVSRSRGRDELRAAQQQVTSEDLRYLAHLFLGAALEDAGEPVEALAQYQAALALRADSQAARLAVVRALGRAGDHAGEREALQPLLTATGADAPDARDPWWRYALGPSACAESEWRRLSAEVAP